MFFFSLIQLLVGFSSFVTQKSFAESDKQKNNKDMESFW